jgi:hypothetical protein
MVKVEDGRGKMEDVELYLIRKKINIYQIVNLVICSRISLNTKV